MDNEYNEKQLLRNKALLPPAEAAAPGAGPQDPYTTWLNGREYPVDARLADALVAQGQLSPQVCRQLVSVP